MKKRLLLFSILNFCILIIFAQQSIKNRKPNIILFLVDDMGWMDTSVPFGDSITALNRKYHTPNMERLAKLGMTFTNAYVNPVCTPTRTSLLTGVSAVRMHITNWTNAFKNQASDYPDSVLQTPKWNSNGISIDATENAFYVSHPLPALLRGAGYHTMQVGKAHWGTLGTPGSNPVNFGFTVSVAGSQAGSPQSYYGESNYGNIPGKTTVNAIPGLYEFYGKDLFLTEALTLKAKQLMEVPITRSEPFFLYLGHYAVHIPIQRDNRFVNRYLKLGFDSTEAAYASLIEGMDKSLGDIMNFLIEKKVDKNTIIIFMSDNGGLADHARGGQRNTQNLPLRAGKGSVYEGGIRVPMIVNWPGVTSPGSRTKQNVIAEDFFATVLNMAGVKRPNAEQTGDSRSYTPILRNPSLRDSSRILLFHYPHRWTAGEENAISWSTAIRQGNWKLVYKMKLKKLELYNLSNDLSEQQDLSSKFPGQLMKLSSLLTKELKRRNAQMPVWKETGKPVSWPDELEK